MSASSSETNLASQAVAPPRLRRLPRRVDRDSTIQSQDEDPAYSTDSNSTAAEDFDKVKSKKHKISFPKFSRRSRQTPSPSQPPPPLTPTKPTWEVSDLHLEISLYKMKLGCDIRLSEWMAGILSTSSRLHLHPRVPSSHLRQPECFTVCYPPHIGVFVYFSLRAMYFYINTVRFVENLLALNNSCVL